MKPEFDLEHAIIETQARHLEILEIPLSRRVFLLMGGVAFLFTVIFFSRIFYFAVAKGDFYKTRSAMNVTQPFTLPAVRGLIYDRFGKVMARNESAFRLVLNVSLAKRQKTNFNVMAYSLGDILGVDRGELLAVIGKADFEKTALITLERDISPIQVLEIQKLGIPALEIQDDYRRYYSGGPALAPVLGYTGQIQYGDLKGKAGLEKYYDSVLAGEDGLRLMYKNAKGEIIEEKLLNAPRHGRDIYTTIDYDFQEYFYRRLQQTLIFLGREIGVGIALNPQNGEVLSLINIPSYDGNIFTTPSTKKERNSLLTASYRPLFNRAISGMYAPGSTVKPMVAIAGLREGVITPQSKVFSSGVLEIPNPYNPDQPSKFLDWRPHGWVDVRSALARSSNIFFYGVGGGFPSGIGNIGDVTKGLGIEKLKEYWKLFGFGEKTGIDLDGENSGFLPDPREKEARKNDIWRLGDTYNVTIGQGDLLVTPIQLLSQIAAIANNGRWYKPHILKEVENEDEVQPELARDFSGFTDEIKEVQEGMKDAVSKPYGTAHALSALAFEAAGKTGSSQVSNNTKTNAFFAAYAPAGPSSLENCKTVRLDENQSCKSEEPQIAILVLIENAREGSLNAVPVGKDVLNWYYWNRLVK